MTFGEKVLSLTKRSIVSPKPELPFHSAIANKTEILHDSARRLKLAEEYPTSITFQPQE